MAVAEELQVVCSLKVRTFRTFVPSSVTVHHVQARAWHVPGTCLLAGVSQPGEYLCLGTLEQRIEQAVLVAIAVEARGPAGQQILCADVQGWRSGWSIMMIGEQLQACLAPARL
jgi:hypothetical protein